MVTYHLSKNLSPRTFLVFMENHGFENFSRHTFLVFMEIHFMNFMDYKAFPPKMILFENDLVCFLLFLEVMYPKIQYNWFREAWSRPLGPKTMKIEGFRVS